MAKTIIGSDGKQYKQKKPFFKRVWFWLFVLVVISIISVVSSSGDDENTSTAKKDSANATKTYAQGDTFKIGKVQYTINSTASKKTVGPSIIPTTAKDTFFIVNVTVKNLSDEKVMLDSSFFTLKKDQKRYEADTMASLSANQNEDGESSSAMLMENINPDVEATGNVVFDVTEALANDKNLTLEIQTGFWGTQTGDVTLK